MIQKNFECPIGSLAIKADENFVYSLGFDTRQTADWGENTLTQSAEKQIEEYFGKRRKTFQINLYLETLSPFRQKVLACTKDIAWGNTTTYGRLAYQAGSPQATRAVGTAMARNPFVILIPCHRVLTSDKNALLFENLKYAGGNATKQKLLQLEGIL